MDSDADEYGDKNTYQDFNGNTNANSYPDAHGDKYRVRHPVSHTDTNRHSHNHADTASRWVPRAACSTGNEGRH
jgi:hypothetical protein